MLKKRYVAYGSNMDEAQMRHRCPTAKLLGKSELKNYRLSFKGEVDRAYATIEESIGEKISVLVWEIEDEDEKKLDLYEDYPILYSKKNVCIVFNGMKIEAMVYIMVETMEYNLPQKEYYEIIEKAYVKFGFDLFTLQDAWKSVASKAKK